MDASTSTSEAPELPGFYFDSEKNRYFRILPGVNNHNPLTTKTIRKKNRESETINKSNKKRIKCEKLTKRKNQNILCILSQREHGRNYDTSESFCTQLTKANIKSIKKKTTNNRHLYGCVKCIIPSLDYSEILHTICSDTQAEIAFCSKNICKEPQSHSWRLGSCKYSYSSISYANFGDLKGYYTNSAMQKIGRLAMEFQISDRNHHRILSFTSSRITPFSCATALNADSKYLYSYGSDGLVTLVSNSDAFFTRCFIHPQGGPGYSCVRLHGDVLAQSFSHSPVVHYNGLRGGQIIGLDTRVLKNKHFTSSMKIEPRVNVSQLLPLRNEFGLIAGYKSSKEIPRLYLWDVRFPLRYVLQYESNCTVNRCEDIGIDIRFTMSADKEDRILTSVLPDLKARLWSIKTGELIKTYPEDDKELVTAAAYTNDWPMFDGKSGLLTAVYKDNFTFLDFVN